MVLFNIGEDRFYIVASFLSMPNPLLAIEQFIYFLFVMLKVYVDFYNPIGLGLMAGAVHRTIVAVFGLVSSQGLFKSA